MHSPESPQNIAICFSANSFTLIFSKMIFVWDVLIIALLNCVIIISAMDHWSTQRSYLYFFFSENLIRFDISWFWVSMERWWLFLFHFYEDTLHNGLSETKKAKCRLENNEIKQMMKMEETLTVIEEVFNGIYWFSVRRIH